ncbi:protein HEG [Echeneis naucrates]|uniref:protein HEG n=1 Tax=Echeneis naucrates TaxID=173247 RepID=UPI0011143435|nr:protein HEG-like [Echeneis naucrates]
MNTDTTTTTQTNNDTTTTTQTNNDTTTTTQTNNDTTTTTQTNDDTITTTPTTQTNNHTTVTTPTTQTNNHTTVTSVTTQTNNDTTSMTQSSTNSMAPTTQTNINSTATNPVTAENSTDVLTTASPTNSTSTPSESPPSTSVPSTTPPENSTTLSPSATTPEAPGNATTLPNASTTQQPTDMTTNTSTTAAPPIPTPSPVSICPFIPCPIQSVCLNSTCQCVSGSFLQNGVCVSAQVFPGQLHLTSLTFQPEMSNRSSAVFQMTAATISAVLREALKDQQGYIRSDVFQLQPGSVLATVNNIFDKTNITEASVSRAIDAAINRSTGFLANATFTIKGENLCEQEPSFCDRTTTACSVTNARPVCSCKEGYVSNIYSESICRACPSGQYAAGDTCKPCAFGHAGFNCNDPALLAVVVISCVLGGVLLILLLALLIYYCCKRCRKSKSDPDSSPYSSDELNQPWPAGVTPIPRATTNWDASPSIEMTEGGSTRALVDNKHSSNGLGGQPKSRGWKKSGSYDLNPEGMKTFKGKNPSRYSYLVQGHENPYFLPGDEKNN